MCRRRWDSATPSFSFSACLATHFKVATSAQCQEFDRRLQARGVQLSGAQAALQLQLPPACLILEPPHSQGRYLPQLLTPRADALISGYFQSYRYAAGLEAELREEFRLADMPDAANARLLERITACPAAVAVHVRRGDYVALQHLHPLCAPAYYQAAGRLIAERLPAARAFVFSDDPAWCRAHLSLPLSCEYVDLNPPEDGPLDLQLMRACRHFIIANSTFSWWGAWLGEQPESMVISPWPWQPALPPGGCPDLLPARWIRLGREDGRPWEGA